MFNIQLKAVEKDSIKFVDVTFDSFGAIPSGGFTALEPMELEALALTDIELRVRSAIEELTRPVKEPFRMTFRIALKPGDEHSDTFRAEILDYLPGSAKHSMIPEGMISPFTFQGYRSANGKVTMQGGQRVGRLQVIRAKSSMQVHLSEITAPDLETLAIQQGTYSELSFVEQDGQFELMCRPHHMIRVWRVGNERIYIAVYLKKFKKLGSDVSTNQTEIEDFTPLKVELIPRDGSGRISSKTVVVPNNFGFHGDFVLLVNWCKDWASLVNMSTPRYQKMPASLSAGGIAPRNDKDDDTRSVTSSTDGTVSALRPLNVDDPTADRSAIYLNDEQWSAEYSAAQTIDQSSTDAFVPLADKYFIDADTTLKYCDGRGRIRLAVPSSKESACLLKALERNQYKFREAYKSIVPNFHIKKLSSKLRVCLAQHKAAAKPSNQTAVGSVNTSIDASDYEIIETSGKNNFCAADGLRLAARELGLPFSDNLQDIVDMFLQRSQEKLDSLKGDELLEQVKDQYTPVHTFTVNQIVEVCVNDLDVNLVVIKDSGNGMQAFWGAGSEPSIARPVLVLHHQSIHGSTDHWSATKLRTKKPPVDNGKPADKPDVQGPSGSDTDASDFSVPPGYHSIKLIHKADERMKNRKLRAIDQQHKSQRGLQWAPVICNHNPDRLERTNVFEGLQPEVLQAAYRTIKDIPWNLKQQEAFTSQSSMYARVQLIHGPAGTGKTTVEAGIAALHVSCGRYVLMTAPSNDQVDVFVEAFGKRFGDIEILRLYPDSREPNLQKSAGVASDTDFIDFGDTDDFDLQDLQMAEEERTGFAAHLYRCPDKSLNAKLLRCANDPNQPPLMIQPMINLGGDVIEHGSAYNAWDLIRDTFERMRETRKNILLEHEALKKQVRTAVAECQKWIIQHAQLICTTSSYATSSILTQNFCHSTGARYVHIQDEAHSELESNAMAFAMLHEPEDNADALVAMILVGDDQQNRPISVEARGKICFNEFVNIGTQSLFTRLLRGGFKSTKLEEQHRCHEDLLLWVNDFAYEGRLKQGRHAPNGPIPTAQKNLFKTILSFNKNYNESDAKVRLAVIVPSNSKVYKHGGTGSSANFGNISKGLEMIFQLMRYYKGDTRSKLLILSPYKATVHIYNQELAKYRKQEKLGLSRIPRVLTVDAASGSQACHVLVDITIADGSQEKRLGFMAEDSRTVVFTTRAEQFLWVISGDLSGSLSRKTTRPAVIDFFTWCARNRHLRQVDPAAKQLDVPAVFFIPGTHSRIEDEDIETPLRNQTAATAPTKPSDDVHKTMSQLQAELIATKDIKPEQSKEPVKPVDTVKPKPSPTRASMQAGFGAVQQGSMHHATSWWTAAHAATQVELDFRGKVAKLTTITKPAAQTDEAAKLVGEKLAADHGILSIPEDANYAGTQDHVNRQNAFKASQAAKKQARADKAAARAEKYGDAEDIVTDLPASEHSHSGDEGEDKPVQHGKDEWDEVDDKLETASVASGSTHSAKSEHAPSEAGDDAVEEVPAWDGNDGPVQTIWGEETADSAGGVEGSGQDTLGEELPWGDEAAGSSGTTAGSW